MLYVICNTIELIIEMEALSCAVRAQLGLEYDNGPRHLQRLQSVLYMYIYVYVEVDIDLCAEGRRRSSAKISVR